MRTRYWFSAVGLLVTLLAAGCTANGPSSNTDKRPVFYGGVTSGGAWP